MQLTPAQAKQLKHLLEQHSGALVLYARSCCSQPEDAVQEAIVELLRQEALPDCPLSWLYQAVRWRAKNLNRSESRRTAHHQRAAEQSEWFSGNEEGLPFDSDELQAALEALSELDRGIVIAKVWGNRTFAEIAEITEISLSSVHRRYHLAIKRLQHELTKTTESGVDSYVARK